MSIDPNQFAELELRVAELSTALERVTAQRDELRDVNQRLLAELDMNLTYLKQLNSDLSRLQVAIQQGGEL
jgi:predicted nuclease with TOPRIM domain